MKYSLFYDTRLSGDNTQACASCHMSEASFLAWLDCTALGLGMAPFDLFLNDARVALSDGREFSSYSDDFVRLNFATTPTLLDEMLERMTQAITKRVS